MLEPQLKVNFVWNGRAPAIVFLPRAPPDSKRSPKCVIVNAFNTGSLPFAVVGEVENWMVPVHERMRTQGQQIFLPEFGSARKLRRRCAFLNRTLIDHPLPPETLGNKVARFNQRNHPSRRNAQNLGCFCCRQHRNLIFRILRKVYRMRNTLHVTCCEHVAHVANGDCPFLRYFHFNQFHLPQESLS